MPADILKPKIPKGARLWYPTEVNLDIEDVILNYDRGLMGAYPDPVAREELCGMLEEPDGEKVAYQYQFADGTQEGLVMLWLPAQKTWGVWPKPPQTTGDCTSRAGSNIGIVTIGMDATQGQPDEETGLVETFPELSETGIRNGVVCWENIYGDRGHRGQGASCDALIKHVTRTGGIILRKNYEGVVDLEKKSELGVQWGGSGTPDKVRALGREHQIRTATNCRNWQNAKDFVFRGYALWICSGLGFSSTRDEWGYSKQSGSWSHSWIIAGWDSRKETIARYGFELALFIHDWGKWNRGPRLVHDTNESIPEGAMWIDARLLDRCDITAMASIRGWAQRILPKFSVPGIF